jgi:hypothetical protein
MDRGLISHSQDTKHVYHADMPCCSSGILRSIYLVLDFSKGMDFKASHVHGKLQHRETRA